ncbi:hypothetical protein BH11BAC1_BH11BAC1_26630 [soil metagenome]
MNTNKKYLSIGLLIIFAIITRLMPHPFNFTAIGALALFSGSVIPNKKLAFIIPFLAMAITDAFLGFHSSMIPVYLCFAITVWIGMVMIKKINLLTIPSAALISSILFFLVTNLPFWYADISLYPLTWQGTVESYTLALPFFANQIAGDLFYSATLFGAYYILRQHYFEPVSS